MFEMTDDLLRSLMRHWPLPESDPVAWRGNQPITRETFLRDLAFARQTLAGITPGDVQGRPALVLFERDAYRFIVWLLAAWSAGLMVVLPGDDLPATRQALPMPWISGEPTPAVGLPSIPDAGHPGVMLFTSGSTGKPALVEKTLRQLRAEAEMFEAAFGPRLVRGTRFVTSVPHQHMYGLPFFMLWSVTAGHSFVVEKLRYPEDLGRLPPADYVLIGAPTFLKHLPDAPASGARFQMATSAGSPLAPEVARLGAAWLGAPLFEIYGSTETGAAAHRQGDSPWQAMPGVHLSLEEGSSRLRIFSPLLSEAEKQTGYLSSDMARLDENGLVLQGRADSVVKIGEKRISLVQIEQALAHLPEVESARIVPLSPVSEGERLTLGAVVILTGTGREKLEKKAALDTHLRNSLRDQLDPLALPRRWRYVEAFPCNEMGKTTRQDMERLFLPTLPHVDLLSSDRESGEQKVTLQLNIPSNLVWFEGHFPSVPILPGVVQLDWAAWFARLHFGFDASAADMSNLKFQHAFRPGETLCLELALRREGTRLEFRYGWGEKTYLHGAFTTSMTP